MQALQADADSLGLREADTDPKEIIGNLFRFNIDLKDPNLASSLLEMLPQLSEKVSAAEKKVDEEFLTLKMEQEIAHMNDTEEVGSFLEMFKANKQKIEQQIEALDIDSMTFLEAAEKYKSYKSQKKETSFVYEATDMYVQLRDGVFQEPKSAVRRSEAHPMP